ncbi:hypothetical protein BDF20DRAFT_838748 [Mycotypha africana]|uniref:uncharacterized protein n=1 Tax=Mycotypha africana TaxID=64632 RepID=UPI0023006062|nr:uncharacterized protein BDF20DRAFT_838748 [Mycotypha africana]KAI8970387.1 hypothetical protein BDF20DRAFT_838748 [Mycotypha africana]
MKAISYTRNRLKPAMRYITAKSAVYISVKFPLTLRFVITPWVFVPAYSCDTEFVNRLCIRDVVIGPLKTVSSLEEPVFRNVIYQSNGYKESTCAFFFSSY